MKAKLLSRFLKNSSHRNDTKKLDASCSKYSHRLYGAQSHVLYTMYCTQCKLHTWLSEPHISVVQTGQKLVSVACAAIFITVAFRYGHRTIRRIVQMWRQSMLCFPLSLKTVCVPFTSLLDLPYDRRYVAIHQVLHTRTILQEKAAC